MNDRVVQSPQIATADLTGHRVAFRAYDIGLISANDDTHTTPVIPAPKAFMRKGRYYFCVFRHGLRHCCETDLVILTRSLEAQPRACSIVPWTPQFSLGGQAPTA